MPASRCRCPFRSIRRRTPCSSPFPYTPLFRSGRPRAIEAEMKIKADGDAGDGKAADQNASNEVLRRSEEHTSELQPLRHLVCRLRLEKKKLGEASRIRAERRHREPADRAPDLP